MPSGIFNRFQCMVKLIGDTPSASLTQTVFDQIWNSGKQEHRIFHTAYHYFNVAGSKTIDSPIRAIRFFAGMTHDVVHSADAPSTSIYDEISSYIRKTDEGVFIAQDCTDPLFSAALTLFNLKAGDKLSPATGQNEFLSGLYALKKGRELGIPDHHLVSVLAHIEGTIAFGNPEHFNTLTDRLKAVNKTLLLSLPEEEIKDVINSATQMANRDVRGFARDFEKFIHGTRLLLCESAAERKNSLEVPQHLFKECMGMTGFLESVSAASQQNTRRIFHTSPYTAAKEKAIIEDDEIVGQHNIAKTSEYLRANAAAATLVRAIIGRDDSIDQAQALSGQLFLPLEPLPPPQPSCSREAFVETTKNKLVTDQIAGYLLTRLGAEGVKTLSNLAVKHLMMTSDFASEAFLTEATQQQPLLSQMIPALSSALQAQPSSPLKPLPTQSLRRCVEQSPASGR